MKFLNNIPAAMPRKKQLFLEQLVDSLRQIPRVVAIVLGGSYASGTYHDASDLDIGLYYFEAEPFSIADIKRIANSISTQGIPTVTDFYEWGPWVNGGAWIHTEIGKVDFLYRNLNQVKQTIDDAHQGIVQHDYDQQPTFGFYSVIYLAEMQICILLYDPDFEIAKLKHQVETYPPKLKEKVIVDSLWSAEFTLLFANNFAATADVYNTVGCLTRVASNLTQALFAINERYFISDKKVLDMIATFPSLPAGYVEQMMGILAHPGETTEELSRTVANLEAVWRSVVALAGETYQPRFRV
jgi:hypothetical protein